MVGLGIVGLVLLAGIGLGIMAACLDEIMPYLAERRQFGQPIGAFQSVSNRIADMKLRLETARLLMYKAAWMLDRKQDASMISALAKLHLGESFFASSIDANAVHGSDSPASAEREIAYFFAASEICER